MSNEVFQRQGYDSELLSKLVIEAFFDCLLVLIV